MRLKNIIVRPIFDSRGDLTVEIELYNQEGDSARAQISRGKSTGRREVYAFDFDRAKKTIAQFILPNIQDKDFKNISELDNFLISLDGTSGKSKLGGNVILGISIAFARLAAQKGRKPLWQLLKEEFFKETGIIFDRPAIFANFINGGAHAKNHLSFQEYLVVAFVRDSVAKTIDKLISLYRELGFYLQENFHINTLPIGDEAGYSVDFRSNLEPLEILESLIKKNHLEQDFRLGIDAAANYFYRDGFYFIDNKKYDSNDLLDYYENLFKKFSLIYSIEDAFVEDDREGFKSLMNFYGETSLIIGDDLTVTNASLITKAHTDKMVNGIIIKPNQIGTITETVIALKMASQYNMKAVVSHRSGETEDNFIIDLSKAAGAFGVKIGAPNRERILKYNHLIRLYE